MDSCHSKSSRTGFRTLLIRKIRKLHEESEKRGILKIEGSERFVILKGKFLLWQKSEEAEKIDQYCALEGAVVQAADGILVISCKDGKDVKIEGSQEQIDDWAESLNSFINAKQAGKFLTPFYRVPLSCQVLSRFLIPWKTDSIRYLHFRDPVRAIVLKFTTCLIRRVWNVISTKLQTK